MALDEKTIEVCAKAAHEVNAAYCRATGDNSQPSWEDAPEWQKTSARKGVVGVLVDLNDPQASHASWLREKYATGWKFGKVKDPALKTHPCIVPYYELPESQRAKDQLYVLTVKSVAAALGFR